MADAPEEREATIAERLAFMKANYPTWPFPGVWAWGPQKLFVNAAGEYRLADYKLGDRAA